MSIVKPQWTVSVGDSDFEQQVIRESHARPVVVDFWAPWCGPCRALTPILEKVIGDQQGQVLLAKVNVDEAQKLAMQFQVQGIPLVIAFRQGKPVAEFDGVRPEAFVREFIQQLMPTEADKLAAEAKQLEAQDLAKAELTYLQALDRDRQNESAALGLSRVMLEQGREKDALEVLGDLGASEEADGLRARAGLRLLAKPLADLPALRERVNREPKNGTAMFELGLALAARGNYADALEMLLSAAELDPKLASPNVRDAMVKVFQLVGPQSPLANEYRNKLSTLLY